MGKYLDSLDNDIKEIIRNNQKDRPVHIVPIIEKLGLTVYKHPGFPNHLSGVIKKGDNDKYEIYVNGAHPITRQRFTMAHELAHYLLHKKEIGDGISDDYLYRSGLSSKIEREANELAAELLMPEDLLLSAPYKNMTIDEQASKFWVSPQAMDIRLGRLL